jgi:hypothetical protein
MAARLPASTELSLESLSLSIGGARSSLPSAKSTGNDHAPQQADAPAAAGVQLDATGARARRKHALLQDAPSVLLCADAVVAASACAALKLCCHDQTALPGAKQLMLSIECEALSVAPRGACGIACAPAAAPPPPFLRAARVSAEVELPLQSEGVFDDAAVQRKLQVRALVHIRMSHTSHPVHSRCNALRRCGW